MFACSRLVHMGGKTKTPSICNRTCPRGAWSHSCDIHCMGQNGKQISDVGGRAQPESRFVLCRACVRRVCLYFGPKLFGRALACTLFLFGPGRFCLFFPPAPQSPISSFSCMALSVGLMHTSMYEFLHGAAYAEAPCMPLIIKHCCSCTHCHFSMPTHRAFISSMRRTLI